MDYLETLKYLKNWYDNGMKEIIPVKVYEITYSNFEDHFGYGFCIFYNDYLVAMSDSQSISNDLFLSNFLNSKYTSFSRIDILNIWEELDVGYYEKSGYYNVFGMVVSPMKYFYKELDNESINDLISLQEDLLENNILREIISDPIIFNYTDENNKAIIQKIKDCIINSSCIFPKECECNICNDTTKTDDDGYKTCSLFESEEYKDKCIFNDQIPVR